MCLLSGIMNASQASYERLPHPYDVKIAGAAPSMHA